MGWIEKRSKQWQLRWRMSGELQVTTWDTQVQAEVVNEYVKRLRGRITSDAVYAHFDPSRRVGPRGGKGLHLSALIDKINAQRAKLDEFVKAMRGLPESDTWNRALNAATLLTERHRHAGMVEAYEAVTNSKWQGRGPWEADDSASSDVQLAQS